MKKTKIDHYTDKEALDFHSKNKPGKGKRKEARKGRRVKKKKAEMMRTQKNGLKSQRPTRTRKTRTRRQLN